MKQYLLLLLGVVVALNGSAQGYTYKPIGFDTSCYWISEYYFYDAGIKCRGEKLSMVVGDTTFGAYRYSKIITYPTAFNFVDPYYVNQCYSLLTRTDPIYLHEDTIARKVYYADGKVAQDFNMAVGDTMVTAGIKSLPVIIDSITVQNMAGVDRRLQWGTDRLSSRFTYFSIDGIGANSNFLVSEFGEWGIPVYRLRCYSKAAQTLYMASGITACPKKPMATVSVKPTSSLTQQSVAISGQELRVLDAQVLPLRIQVYDMIGRLVVSHTVNTMQRMQLGLMPGSYLLRLYRENETAAIRLQVP